MNLPILTMEVRVEPDIVLARQRARQIAGLLGFAPLDQTRVATAVSEVARNSFQYAGGGKVEFQVEEGPSPSMVVLVRQRGSGIKDLRAILEGNYDSPTGLGLGVLGAKRLMDRLDVDSSAGGATVTLSKSLPKRQAPLTAADLSRISAELARMSPQGLLEELQVQNEEVIRTLQELKDRQAELAELHARELEETNRGVVALYSELDDNAKELKRVSELKSRFLSSMSHEFRSPLNTILSMSRFLLSGSSGELTAEQEKEVGFIRKAAESLSTLVNDLLDLAKVEAGRAVIRVEEFEVAALFETLRGTSRSLLTQGTVELVVEDAAGLPRLRTDEGKLTQILRNFLSNAAKFTERGEIRLGASPGPGDMVIFTVADTGIGIAPADRSRVFEEFSQVEGPLQNRVKGTGLGLPLSRKLAELLGGGVSVRSEPGVGSTFYALIPREYRPPEEPGPGPDPAIDPARAPVLVVEDDPVCLMLYEKFLAGTGFQMIPARSLVEARGILRKVRPTAILLDILLEAESGWTLLAEMKDQPATRDIPILVLTVVEGREQALALGAFDFGHKPIRGDWLVGRLNALKSGTPVETILIIDDEEADRHRLKGLLNALGVFAIVEASGGVDGLRMARQHRPDVIFLDLVMPDLTGFEVMEALKAEEATAGIPLIINTSTDLDEQALRRLAPRAAAILSKSVDDADRAFAEIRDALGRAGLDRLPDRAGS